MKAKKYCEDCKYFMKFYRYEDNCSHDNPEDYEDTYLRREFKKLVPSIANKNNNCKYFKPL